MMDAYSELVKGGDTRLHHHLEDRIPTHETLRTLQAVKRIVAVSSDYAALDRDDVIEVDTSGGDVDVTLLLGKQGKEITVSKTAAANTLTIYPTSPQTINGGASLAMTAQWASRTLKYVGNDDWRVIASA